MVRSTIVIPNYNGIKYIEDCLESLYTQTTSEFDVILVDNASKDGSLELVKEKFPQVKIIENSENTGFDKAVNQGIEASSTEYVILLNNDTRVDKSFVHNLEKAMDSDKKLFSASAKLISLHDKTKIDDAGDYYCVLGWAFARGKGKHPDKYNKDYDIFASCGGGAIYRRSLFDKVGMFDEKHFAYLEDIDIGYRALLHGYRNRYVADAIVYHAGSATSGSRYNSFKTKLASRNSIYLIYKNMPPLQIILNLPFFIVGFGVKTLFFIRKGMGKDYVSGLASGFKMSREDRGQNKVSLGMAGTLSYLKLEIHLIKNLFLLGK